MGQSRQPVKCAKCAEVGPRKDRAKRAGWDKIDVWICPTCLPKVMKEAAAKRAREYAEEMEERKQNKIDPMLAAALGLAMRHVRF